MWTDAADAMDTEKGNTDKGRAPVSIMIVAASDSGGCAGVQADLRTCAALGVFATTALTAVTAQSSAGVADCRPMPPDSIRSQMECAGRQQHPLAIKTGLVPSADAAAAIAAAIDALPSLKGIPIVADPVAAATAGALINDPGWLGAYRRHILPRATLLTPNLPELELLSGTPCRSDKATEEAARALMEAYGCLAVWVKGGHAPDPDYAVDTLLCRDDARPVRLIAPRIDSPNLRGTGCTLSTAAACWLAKGLDLRAAVAKAHDYLRQAILAGRHMRYDAGAGPVNHLFNHTAP